MQFKHPGDGGPVGHPMFPNLFFGTWNAIRKDPKGFLMVQGIIIALLAGVNAFFAYAVKAPATIRFFQGAETSTLTDVFDSIGLLLAVLTVLLVLATATLTASRIMRGEAASLDDAVALLSGRFWTFCAVILAVLAPTVLVFLLSAVFDTPWLGVIGIIAGVIVFLGLLSRWAPALASIVGNTELKPGAAMSEATKQTQGNRRPIVGAFLVVFGICMAVTLPILAAIGNSAATMSAGVAIWRTSLFWATTWTWAVTGAALTVLGAFFATVHHETTATAEAPVAEQPDTLPSADAPIA